MITDNRIESMMNPKSINGKPLRLSKLAEKTGLSVHCIRTYTDRGLVSACDRTGGGYLLYPDSAIGRLQFIRIAREADVPVSELVRLFSAGDRNDPSETAQCLADLENYILDKRNRLSNLEHSLTRIFTRADPECYSSAPAEVK